MKTVAELDAAHAVEMALLDRLDDAFRVQERAHRATNMPDIALGFRRARGLLDAVRGDIHRKHDAAKAEVTP